MELADKKVFITGGSAGIGKAIIKEVSEKGVTNIAVMGRTQQKLDDLEKEFPSIQFIKIQGDVSQLDDVKNAVQTITKKWGELDILINNAGVVSAGQLESISDEDIAGMVSINVTGLLWLTKHLLPLLKETEEGAIINVSSGLGYIAMPFYSIYAATKAAVKHFSESLRRELDPYPIHVMTIYPTATDTDMMKSANAKDMDSPEEVAKASVEGLVNNDYEVILGGEKQKEMIQANVQHPLKVDEKINGMFEAMKERTKNHRAM